MRVHRLSKKDQLLENRKDSKIHLVLACSGVPRGWPVKSLSEAIFLAARDVCPVSRGLSQTWMLDISVVSDAEMRKINRNHRGKNAVTDVLSFENPAIAAGGAGISAVVPLGSLVLCRSVVTKQARSQGHSIRVELAVLLVHGFLHLLGFDHEGSAKKAKTMMDLENQLLEHHRVQGVYGGPARRNVKSGLIQRVQAG